MLTFAAQVDEAMTDCTFNCGQIEYIKRSSRAVSEGLFIGDTRSNSLDSVLDALHFGAVIVARFSFFCWFFLCRVSARSLCNQMMYLRNG